MSDIINIGGRTYVKSEEGHRGKKAQQVATMLKVLQENPGVPYSIDELCEAAGQKYPTDVVAATMALHLVELVDIYKLSDGESTIYYVWTEE